MRRRLKVKPKKSKKTMSWMKTLLNCFKKAILERPKFYLDEIQFTLLITMTSSSPLSNIRVQTFQWKFTQILSVYIHFSSYHAHGTQWEERSFSFFVSKIFMTSLKFFLISLPYNFSSSHLCFSIADGSFIFLFRFFHLLNFCSEKKI